MRHRYRILTTSDNRYIVEKFNPYFNGSFNWWKWSPMSFDTIENAKKWIHSVDLDEDFIPEVVWDSLEQNNKYDSIIEFFMNLSFEPLFSWTRKTINKK